MAKNSGAHPVFPVLEKWMRQTGWSANKLAAKIGCSPNTFRGWRHGIGQPDLKRIQTLVQLTGIPFERLFQTDQAVRLAPDTKHMPRPYTQGRRKYKIIYPVLERWMVANNQNFSTIARAIGSPPSAIPLWLYGFRNPLLPDVKRLILLTGIPFEQLFREG